jgi:predicted transcriptional regulator
MVVLTARVKDSDHRALDRLARLTGRKIGEVIREAVRVYIIEQERIIEKAEREFEDGQS